MMPTMEPVPTKATTMNEIGYKKTKHDDSVYKAKLKKKLEKKLEDEDSDYEPNSFEAKDSNYELDVANCKPLPETIAVQENDGVCQLFLFNFHLKLQYCIDTCQRQCFCTHFRV